MIRRLMLVFVVAMAVNFLALAGGVGWLALDGRLTRESLKQVQAALFPPAPAPEAAQEEAPTTQPLVRIDELLAKHSGFPAAQQVLAVQTAFDARAAELDRRARELIDLQRQLTLAREQLTKDRTTFDAEVQQLRDREQVAQRTAEDQGFQDALALYSTMPSRQVKSILAGLDDATVVRYLRAMPPRTAARIVKEFKTSSEIARIQGVLEMMRQSQADASP